MAELCRFVPDKEFSGTDRAAGGRRDGPVNFEKDEQEDPFGLSKFLGEAKEAKKRTAGEPAGREHKKRRD